jgi:dimethylhistidine N-methyltransferase
MLIQRFSATRHTPMVQLTDQKPETELLVGEVLEGLRRSPKELPCKLLYDERGSSLYNQICELPEYYPARTETRITLDNIKEIAELIGPRCLLIEYGSGSSDKTRVLLETLSDPAAYVPIDISKEHLLNAARDIHRDYPELEVLPVCADYTNHIDLPTPTKPVERRVVYFPGSTIGNFDPEDAIEFLARLSELCGPGDGLLIGVDLRKDPEILELAYDDPAGVTAKFNLNILRHINNEIGSDFDTSEFRHRAVYNMQAARVEMHLVSESDQKVRINGSVISLQQGEKVWTESSYKYSLESFAELASKAGFSVEHVWTDNEDLFSVQYLTR